MIDKRNLNESMSVERPQGRFSVSAVLSTFNEEENLPFVISRIPSWVDEVILVDAHSTDKTVEIAQRLRPSIKILYQPGEGKDDAMKYGIEKASGDIVIMLDADGQNDPADAGMFIEPLLKGYDFAKGSRLAKGRPLDMPWHRWLGNVLIVGTCNMLYRTKFTDLCSGYNAFWRKTFLNIEPWKNNDWGYEPALIAQILKGKLKVSEVSYLYMKRVDGKSKLPDFKQGLAAIKVLLRERFRA